jgi:hypothetical protein
VLSQSSRHDTNWLASSFSTLTLPSRKEKKPGSALL